MMSFDAVVPMAARCTTVVSVNRYRYGMGSEERLSIDGRHDRTEDYTTESGVCRTGDRL